MHVFTRRHQNDIQTDCIIEVDAYYFPGSLEFQPVQDNAIDDVIKSMTLWFCISDLAKGMFGVQ